MIYYCLIHTSRSASVATIMHNTVPVEVAGDWGVGSIWTCMGNIKDLPLMVGLNRYCFAGNGTTHIT